MLLHFLLMTMFAVVAVRFTVFADQHDDELMRWFGAGAALAAFARLNYLLFPSLYSQYVYTGDGFRLGFYLLLLVGAGREIASYWSGLAETAAMEERRRMARDLHDGLAQELAFMWSDIQGLKRAHPDDEKVERASSSAERALDESRRAIAAFARPAHEPLDIAISTSIEEVARRLQVRLRLRSCPRHRSLAGGQGGPSASCKRSGNERGPPRQSRNDRGTALNRRRDLPRGVR